jgi:hypothetical protein
MLRRKLFLGLVPALALAFLLVTAGTAHAGGCAGGAPYITSLAVRARPRRRLLCL